ncbi:MAG: energy transducer TonB [Saprospiraceae bacterium]
MKKDLTAQFQIFVFFLIAVVIFTYSCSAKKQLNSTKELIETPSVLEEVKDLKKESYPYYVFKDGMYVEEVLDKKPVIIGVYQRILYPPFAREHGIQGTVLITVTVNEFGQLEDAVIHSHVGGGCDEEALRVVKLSGQNGFTPAEINGKPVKVKYDIPLRFILQ